MKEKVLIIGAGGHAKVVVDILLEQKKYEVVGFVDRDSEKEYRGIKVIGQDEELSLFYKNGIRKVFVALGSNKIRKKLQIECKNIGFDIINIISSRATISPTVKLGNGIVIMDGAIVHADAVVKDGCIINTNASVDHDCCIDEYTHIAPGTAISGYTAVGRECFIGTGCSIIDGITIGDHVTVGAGGVVVKDIIDSGIAVGIPAKIKKKNI